MAQFKIVISNPKTGKTVQREVKDQAAKSLIGKKLRETLKGELFDLNGYEFQITGGSDIGGFPMRSDIEGIVRKKILAVEGIGLKRQRRGQRQRKSVAGNTIYEGTAQINLMITKMGNEDIFPKKEEKKAEAAEAKAEEKVPEKKEKKEKKEETKAEQAEEKAEAKPEEKAPEKKEKKEKKEEKKKG